MLKQRIATALLLGTILIAIIILGPPWLFSVFILACVLGGAWEWAGLAAVSGVLARLLYAIILAMILLPVYAFSTQHGSGLLLASGVVWWCLALVMVLAYQSGRQILPAGSMIKLIAGAFVLLPAAACLMLLSRQEQSVEYLLLFFVLVWLLDSAAYFSGRHWGKHRLASHVSPGKSWEGVIGGLLAAVILAAVYSFWREINLWQVVLLFLLTGLFSVVGDLFESLCKREAGVKDSGCLLPGHGGVLDRIDSLTAAAPVFVLGLSLMGGRL